MVKDEVSWDHMDEVIAGKRYRTWSSNLISYKTWVCLGEYGRKNCYKERTGLYKTEKGNYFSQYEKYDDGRGASSLTVKSRIKALSRNKALELYWQCENQVVPLEEAFPGVEIEDA
jgi:hypothetical protein